MHCDMWSCGIALYMMSTRKTPYDNSKEDNNLHALVESGEIVRKSTILFIKICKSWR